MKKVSLVLMVLSLGATACDSTSSTTIPAVLPVFDPSSFVAEVDNTYWPLIPGSRWVYEGEDEGEFEHIEVTVEPGSRSVAGIAAVVVRDIVTLGNGVVEDTFDWYAQDAAGDVWYLGEDSKVIEDGEVVATTGSWEAGVDGAQPGVLMWADPVAQVGSPYYQEFYEGEAEDKAEVVRLGDTVTVAAGTFDNVLVTREWNPLEPGLFELKYYAPGVGLILEEIEEGGEARIELVSFTVGG
jgi:hypothetical protein